MGNHPSGEQFRTEASLLHESEDLYRLIINQTNASIILVGADMNILVANDFVKASVRKLMGREIAEGTSIFDVSPYEDPVVLKENISRVLSGEKLQLERDYQTSEGHFYYAVEFMPVYNRQHAIIGALILSQNITEAKKAENQLQESEERWRFALEGANQGAWDWNLLTNEVFYSDSYRRLYGYSEEDELENINDWKSRLHPDDLPLVNNALKEHLNSKDPYYETRYRILNKQGQYQWIWARGMVMNRDASGKPLRMIGTHSDITQQVNAELTYHSLFKSNPLPCWIYEATTGKFLEVNDAALRHYGFTEKEFMEASLQLVHPAEQNEKLQERLKHEKREKNQSISNWKHRKKNGEVIFVDLGISSILYKGIEAKLVVIHDVTHKVKVEQELRRSNERFLYAARASSEALWEWDSTTNFFYASQAYTDIFGWEVQPNRTFDEWHDYIHHEDREATIQSFYDSLKDPSIAHWRKEYRYQKSNGSYAHVIDKASILRDEAGNAIRVIGALQDITEQKRTEEALRKSNERYEHVLTATSDIVWDWDIRKEEVLWSENYTKTFGWELPPDRLMPDVNCFPKFHDEDRQRVINSMQQAVNDPLRFHWYEEFRYLKKDGDYAYVADRGYLIRNEKGEAIRMIGAMQDVTRQKKAEEHIRKTNDLFSLVNRATSDAIYDWNIQRSEITWNEGLQILFGFNPNHVTIEVWEQMIHPADRTRVLDSLHTALNGDTSLWKEEYRFLRADGRYSYVLERGFLIRDEQGKPLRLIGSMQDITERHYGEQLLSLEKTIFELSTNPKLEFRNIVLTLLKGIEEIHEDAFTSVLLLNQSDETLQPFVSPRLPKEYSEKLHGLKIGPEEGSCGAAMAGKKKVIVENVATHPYWRKYKKIALEHGLQACWSLPIIHSNGHVMGSFAIYYKKIKAPSEKEINTFERMTSILRVLMENAWSVQQIREAKERFDIMMRATHDLIWDWNLETNFIYRDQLGLRQVYGVEDNETISDYEKWMERVHPDDREKLASTISQILAAAPQNHFEVEYRFKGDDGNYSYVYDRGILLRNGEGRPVRMIGAAQDITERKRLEQELLQNELEKQKAINQASVDTQEAERSEIGKELHDNVNQVLTTTKLYLDLAMSSPELKDELIVKSNKNIINVINEIRQLSRSLMDPSIGDLGLMDSIHDLVENINLTRKLQVKLVSDKKMETLLDKNHKLTIFRIIQEALNNAMRHAKATMVTIAFKTHAQHIEILIEDNGVGFDPRQVKKGAGLKNIQNRIYLINGTHTIETAPGKGCKLFIKFPFIKQQTELTN